jgi:hypothetical protein
LTDGPNHEALEVIFLGLSEKPPAHVPWLIIVKTHGLDFELIVTVSRWFLPVTLGTDATLEAALDRATQAAERFGVEKVYVTGVLER